MAQGFWGESVSSALLATFAMNARDKMQYLETLQTNGEQRKSICSTYRSAIIMKKKYSIKNVNFTDIIGGHIHRIHLRYDSTTVLRRCTLVSKAHKPRYEI